MHQRRFFRGLLELEFFLTCARPVSVNRMVALLAQAEEVDNGIQLSPPGMHAIFLPYAEDVREPKSTFEKAEIKPEGAKRTNLCERVILTHFFYY